MGLNENLYMAKLAFDHVNKMLPRGAGNKPTSSFEQKQCVRHVRSDAYVMDRRHCWAIGADACEGTFEYRIENAARAGERHKCGNCAEHTAVGFMLLRALHIGPLDFMALRENDLAFHQFLVIGRTAESRVEDVRTWGSDAVVMDAWHGHAPYPASEIPKKMYGKEQMRPRSLWRFEGVYSGNPNQVCAIR